MGDNDESQPIDIEAYLNARAELARRARESVKDKAEELRKLAELRREEMRSQFAERMKEIKARTEQAKWQVRQARHRGWRQR